ncbi:MAG: hypothetical protein JXQ93_01865 [Flavobacteriaceae bacterium]
MDNKFSKILTIIIALLSVIGIILFVVVSSADETDPKVIDAAVSPLITFSTFLFYAAVAITVVLSIVGMVKNPENLKKTLLGLVVLGVLLVVSYILGDSNAVLDAQNVVIEGGEAGASSNQWVGTLIWYSTILVLIGGVFFIFDLLKGLVKS